MKYVKHRIVFLSHIHMKSADKQTDLFNFNPQD